MYIGFDIGGTNIKYGLINERGDIIEKSLIKTRHEKKKLIDDIARITKTFEENYEISGLGISVPGIIQKNGYSLTGGAIQELYGTNFKEEIENKTGIETAIENDANSVAIAEKWHGNAKGIDNYICVVLGTGVGGGIVINGEIYRGAHGMAGEFGYMVTHDFNDYESIEEYSLNQTASVVGGLYKQYNLELERNNLEPQKIKSAKEIMEKSNSGDKLAKRVMDKYYEDISIGVINLISVFDPELVLIGGGISSNSEFMKNLTQTIDDLQNRHNSIKFLKGKTIARVIPAKYKNDAGIIGSVYQVKKMLESKKNLSIIN